MVLMGLPGIFLKYLGKNWSGRRDSNPRPQPWQGHSRPDTPLANLTEASEAASRNFVAKAEAVLRPAVFPLQHQNIWRLDAASAPEPNIKRLGSCLDRF